jgi:hypothetical protein
MKYINVTAGGMRGLVLFPEYLCHADVACGRQVHSAGFVDLDAMVCYGDSVSLGIKSSPHDTARRRAMFGDTHAPELPVLLQRQAS